MPGDRSKSALHLKFDKPWFHSMMMIYAAFHYTQHRDFSMNILYTTEL